MPSFDFSQSDPVWPEISVFVEAALARWFTDDFATQLHDDLEIEGVQCSCLVLHGAVKHSSNLRTLMPKRKRKYRFTERPASANSPVYRVHYDDHFYTTLQQIVFGHGFEKLRLLASQKWGGRRNWPEAVQFGYHVRNGSFHGNHFHFTTPVLGAPAWRSVTVTQALEGQIVMGRPGGVLGFADIPVLLHDIQSEVCP